LIIYILVVNSLSNSEISLIINCHNNYRSLLANGKAQNKTGLMPKGKNIKQLKYSKELEKSSANWASKCLIKHSYGNNGENLFMSTNIKLSIKNALNKSCNSWWNELKGIGMQGNLIFDQSFKGNGHSTQMAWAKTTKIGCAVNRCPNSKWKTFVVCQYKPHGNVLNKSIYQKGQPCTGCGKEGCNYSNGLCK
ncbi:SCP domain-containing protein, partial [Meloidogyne graminicola]